MKRQFETDADVELEIERLKESKYVKLCKQYDAVQNRRRQYMYSLRSMEKRGKMLYASGITSEYLNEIDTEDMA